MGQARGSEAVGGGNRVLVVEDAPEFRHLVVSALGKEGFVVETADDGHSAVQHARSFNPDLIVLDLSLPGLDGLEVCRQVRIFSDAYILMLTGRDDEVDKVIGLSVGADDYVTKPFSPRELMARVTAMLRRPHLRGDPTPSCRQFGALAVDPASRAVRVGGQEVELTKIEFDLLDVLSESPRIVFSRPVLLERVWGPNWHGDDHVVDVHISKLRRKLGDDPRSSRYVLTVRGVGFRLGSGA